MSSADVDGAPEGYVALMRELWHQDPVARPTFAEALRRLREMLAATPLTTTGSGELDLVSDLFKGPGEGGSEEEEDVLLRSLQGLSSTPTAGDYARTLGHASVVDHMMAANRWKSR